MRWLLSFALVVSANTLFAQPYTFDENGNGIQLIALNPMAMPFEVAPDPSGGISTSPVLIYSLGGAGCLRRRGAHGTGWIHHF